jgi:monoterpene epsilon-lactone hydrolase
MIASPDRISAWLTDVVKRRSAKIAFAGFPAILTSGTRDLLLSNTVRVHRELRAAGVEAQLEVYEGHSHAQYLFDDRLPETAVAFGEIAEFFDKHLGK